MTKFKDSSCSTLLARADDDGTACGLQSFKCVSVLREQYMYIESQILHIIYFAGLQAKFNNLHVILQYIKWSLSLFVCMHLCNTYVGNPYMQRSSHQRNVQTVTHTLIRACGVAGQPF